MTQRTRLWIVALVVGGLFVALPGVALAETDTARATTTSRDGDAVGEIHEIKHRALHAIDRRLHTLARLIKFVNGSKHVTDQHAATLLADLRDAAAGLTELARKIKAAETIEELRELVPQIATEFRIYTVVKPKVIEVVASDRVTAASERLGNLAAILEELIARAEAAGYDVTRPKVILERMRFNIGEAARLGGPVADMVIDLQPEDWPDPAKATLREGRWRLDESFDQLRMAKYRARKIIRWLRSLVDPPVDISELA